MTVHEFNELIDLYNGKDFDTLNVTMDTGEEAEFNDGTIYYNARGFYYYVKAHGYKVGSTRSYANIHFVVTIFCKQIISIDCK